MGGGERGKRRKRGRGKDRTEEGERSDKGGREGGRGEGGKIGGKRRRRERRGRGGGDKEKKKEGGGGKCGEKRKLRREKGKREGGKISEEMDRRKEQGEEDGEGREGKGMGRGKGKGRKEGAGRDRGRRSGVRRRERKGKRRGGGGDRGRERGEEEKGEGSLIPARRGEEEGKRYLDFDLLRASDLTDRDSEKLIPIVRNLRMRDSYEAKNTYYTLLETRSFGGVNLCPSGHQASNQFTQPHQQQNPNPVGAGVEVGKFGLEEEVERLKRDKNVLMQELVRLRQQQQTTDNQIQSMVQRLRETTQHIKEFGQAHITPGLKQDAVVSNGHNESPDSQIVDWSRIVMFMESDSAEVNWGPRNPASPAQPEVRYYQDKLAFQSPPVDDLMQGSEDKPLENASPTGQSLVNLYGGGDVVKNSPDHTKGGVFCKDRVDDHSKGRLVLLVIESAEAGYEGSRRLDQTLNTQLDSRTLARGPGYTYGKVECSTQRKNFFSCFSSFNNPDRDCIEAIRGCERLLEAAYTAVARKHKTEDPRTVELEVISCSSFKANPDSIQYTKESSHLLRPSSDG
ncbi:heat shock factor protein HSF8-like protein [Tanacetum coccineum]